MRFSIRNPKANALHAEAVARERRKLRGEPPKPSAAPIQSFAPTSNVSDSELTLAHLQFQSVLLDLLTDELGLGQLMIEYKVDPLAIPTGPFTARFMHAGEGDLIVECKHAGEG